MRGVPSEALKHPGESSFLIIDFFSDFFSNLNSEVDSDIANSTVPCFALKAIREQNKKCSITMLAPLRQNAAIREVSLNRKL